MARVLYSSKVLELVEDNLAKAYLKAKDPFYKHVMSCPAGGGIKKPSRTPVSEVYLHMTTTMDSTSTLCALVPLTPPEGSTLKLAGYKLVTDEKEILANPEWPIHATKEAALKSLRRGTRAPAGCTRVIAVADIPYHARRTMARAHGLHLHRWGSHTIYGAKTYTMPDYVVTDMPIVVDPSQLTDNTVELFKRLPILTHMGSDLTKTLLKKFDDCRITDNSVLWGLPTLQLPRFTKAGLPYRSPRHTLALAREQFLYLHCADDSHCDYLRLLHQTLYTAFTVRRPGGSLTPFTASHYLTTFQSDTPWRTQVQHALHNWQTLTNNTQALIRNLIYFQSRSSYCLKLGYNNPVTPSNKLGGPLSTLPRFFKKFPDRRRQILLALSLMRPWLRRLRTPLTDDHTCNRMSSHDISTGNATRLAAYRSLYKLAHMCECRAYPALDPSPLLQEQDS